MTEAEKKLKRKVQLIVVGAMSFFFILVTVITFQFAIRGNQRGREKNLLAEKQRLETQLADIRRDMFYLSTLDFINDYALYVMGWGKIGQINFEKE